MFGLSIKMDVTEMLDSMDKLDAAVEKKAEPMLKNFGKYFYRNTRVEAKKFAPTESEITSKFNSLKYVKYRGNKNGKIAKDPKAELKRRINRIGVFAKGWRFWKFEKTKDHSMKYWIVDTVGYADNQDSKYHPAQIAADKLQSRFQTALEQTVQGITATFK